MLFNIRFHCKTREFHEKEVKQQLKILHFNQRCIKKTLRLMNRDASGSYELMKLRKDSRSTCSEISYVNYLAHRLVNFVNIKLEKIATLYLHTLVTIPEH